MKGLFASLRYKILDQWRFRYFYLFLDRSEDLRLSDNPAIRIFKLSSSNLDQVRSDLFHAMGDNSKDRSIFEVYHSHQDVECWLAERDRKIVHYCWVFYNVYMSPIATTPFRKSLLRSDDIFIGPVFTSPQARGFIFLVTLCKILNELKGVCRYRRVLVFAYSKNIGAFSFYRRMGFMPIKDPYSLMARVYMSMLRFIGFTGL